MTLVVALTHSVSEVSAFAEQSLRGRSPKRRKISESSVPDGGHLTPTAHEAPASLVLPEITLSDEPRSVPSSSELAAPVVEPAAPRNVYLVGIAGPSGSGKTSLARRLSAVLHSPLLAIEADWYFMKDKMPKDPRWGQNYELPSGIDWTALHADLLQLRSELASAAMLPSAERPARICTARMHAKGESNVLRKDCEKWLTDVTRPLVIVVEVDCETCLKRRFERDSKKAKKKPLLEDFSEWFHSVVWANYEKHRGQQLKHADQSLRLDATKSLDEMLQEARSYCLQRFTLRDG